MPGYYWEKSEDELDRLYPDRIREKREWRDLFDKEKVMRAADSAEQKKILYFNYTSKSCSATVKDVRMSCNVQIANAPTRLSENWIDARLYCSCSRGKGSGMCQHLADVLYRWEKDTGPFFAGESEYEYLERKSTERRQKEQNRRRALRNELGDSIVPAISFWGKRNVKKGLVFFDIQTAIEPLVTTPYYMARAREILQEEASQGIHGVKEIKTREGRKILLLSCNFSDDLSYVRVDGMIEGGRIVDLSSSIADARSRRVLDDEIYRPEPGEPLDEYQLVSLKMAWDYVNQHMEGDQTDQAAKQFFRQLSRLADVPPEASLPDREEEKKCILDLMPRIVVEDGAARLSFKIGKSGGRMYILRNLRELIWNHERGTALAVTKKETIDFSRYEFREESMPVMQFIERRVGEIGAVNEKLASRNFGRGVSSIAVTYQMDLRGSLLDSFYDMAEGMSCEFQDKSNADQDAFIRVGYRSMRFRLTSERISDARDTFAGVAVSGLIPVLLHGSSEEYILNKDGLSRITAEERAILEPFRNVADASGYFRFTVGLSNLQEYYYRVLPSLLSNPSVEIEDHASEEAGQYLPPEPSFEFFLDYEEPALTLKCQVSYDEKTYLLGEAVPRGEYRDEEQEKRVQTAILRYLNDPAPGSGIFRRDVTDDALYDFLRIGIEDLSRYGIVKGTEAFRSQKVRPVPQVQVGVSVESNLLDITVTSRDVSKEDLLQLLYSYKLKKRYYRLKSGDFVDLSRGEDLGEVEAFLSAMDIQEDRAIGEKVQIPLYRALYLDRLLEEHDALSSSRDRTYRALVKNFRIVRDADYELPKDMQEVVRPYQNYGFKWLKTLENAGFGGILADEMGLGKTLQMISLILSDKEEDQSRTSLVVCPASLVYNWQEEFRRFAPSVNASVVSGTLANRKAVLNNYKKADVLITSYDTLKRDILLYKDMGFHICVLDEAQFIKNPKAAVTKAVKAVRAACRFALTGTPIENRLSELWSIFDFLMPGFLYSSQEFSGRYEIPIMKEQDEEATERLRKMTGPFILRRCKKDVLKDLPAKLEEVRYARLSGEQQKIYDAQVVRMLEMLSGGASGGEDKIRIFAELTRIREICCDPSLILEEYEGESAKREACLELIRSAMDGGHRMLVFSQFTSMLALLEKDLKEEGIPYFLITGQTPKEKRLSLVHTFNEGDVPVFLISLKAGGTGLNLVGADVVIHYDPWWNLAVQNQATDRAHRIGQTRDVTVYKLILKDTIEEKIMQLQETKKDLADAIMEGSRESIMSLTSEELMSLLS